LEAKVITTRKEQLTKEYTRLIIELMDENQHLNDMLPPVADIGAGEKLKIWTPTKESLKEYDAQYKKIEKIYKRRREILDELSQLPRGK
jgi:hypothetical protein